MELAGAEHEKSFCLGDRKGNIDFMISVSTKRVLFLARSQSLVKYITQAGNELCQAKHN